MNQDKLNRITKCIGTARSFLQHNVKNGSTVTWGSQEIIQITAGQIEEMAMEIAEKAYKGTEEFVLSHKYTCEHCGARKVVASGMCEECHKFPVTKSGTYKAYALRHFSGELLEKILDYIQIRGNEDTKFTGSTRATFIDHAFRWDKTQEGYEYWNSLYDQMEDEDARNSIGS